MNSAKKNQKFSLLVVIVLLFAHTACGVKGDPLPPEKPAPLGRGRPTYKKAAEKIKPQKPVPGSEEDDDKEQEDSDEE